MLLSFLDKDLNKRSIVGVGYFKRSIILSFPTGGRMFSIRSGCFLSEDSMTLSLSQRKSIVSPISVLEYSELYCNKIINEVIKMA